MIPMGTSSPSVTQHVARVQVYFSECAGIEFHMHSYGTTIEGEWDDVMRAIGGAHQCLHETGVVRIASDIRVGTRTDKAQTSQQKVDSVQDFLATDM